MGFGSRYDDTSSSFGSHQGTWWLRSKKDPLWNAEGQGFVSIYGSEDCECTIKELEARLGQRPDDLEWGFAKC